MTSVKYMQFVSDHDGWFLILHLCNSQNMLFMHTNIQYSTVCAVWITEFISTHYWRIKHLNNGSRVRAIKIHINIYLFIAVLYIFISKDVFYSLLLLQQLVPTPCTSMSLTMYNKFCRRIICIKLCFTYSGQISMLNRKVVHIPVINVWISAH